MALEPIGERTPANLAGPGNAGRGRYGPPRKLTPSRGAIRTHDPELAGHVAWAITAVVCVALAAVVAAVASLNVALPDIARSTHATQTQLEWVIDAYSLVFAALLLLPGGAIGDRFGRRLAAGTISIFVQFLAFFGFIFVVLQYLQLVRGDTAVVSAVSMLPMAAVLR